MFASPLESDKGSSSVLVVNDTVVVNQGKERNSGKDFSSRNRQDQAMTMTTTTRMSGVDGGLAGGFGISVNFQVLLWYAVFGTIHELVHVTTMAMLFGFEFSNCCSFHDMITFIVRAMIGRACHMDASTLVDEHHHQHHHHILSWQFALIRHSGWIFSVMVVLILLHFSSKKANDDQSKLHRKDDMKLAAIVTAVEAICTDLLNLGTVNGINNNSMTTKLFFFCGNFGVILLSPTWTTTNGDHGKTALTLLEKMIEVTMMRGAQTGGVITWIHRGGKGNKDKRGGSGSSGSNVSNKGIRCRVVNGKRTDLSKKLRAKLDHDICMT